MCISVPQPSADLIMGGYKDIVCRTWNTSFRGALLIHAAAKIDKNWRNDLSAKIWYQTEAFFRRRRIATKGRFKYVLGAVIGAVLCHSVDRTWSSHWCKAGPYYYLHFSNPFRFSKPIPSKGRLKMYHPPTGWWDALPQEDQFQFRKISDLSKKLGLRTEV